MEAQGADVESARLQDGVRRELFDGLVAVLYEQLRGVAHRQLGGRCSESSLTTTGLVHEAYLKLAGSVGVDPDDQTHFLATAAVAMRHVLVNRASARATAKRGGARPTLSLEDAVVASDEHPELLLELNDALDQLAAVEPRLARVVEYRFFGGLREEEIASALGITVRTVERDWAKARLLLQRKLEG